MRASLLFSDCSQGFASRLRLISVSCWTTAIFFSCASCSFYPFIGSQQTSPLPPSTPTIYLGSFNSFVSVKASEVFSTAVYTVSTDRKTAGGVKLISNTGLLLGSVSPMSDGCVFHLLHNHLPVLLSSCDDSPSKVIFSVQAATLPSSTTSTYALGVLFIISSGSVLSAGVELSQTSYVIGANMQEVSILDLSNGEQGPAVLLQEQDASAPVGVFEFRETSYCLVSKLGHKHHIIRNSDLGPMFTGETPFVSRFYNVDDTDELGSLFAFDATSVLRSVNLQDFVLKGSLDLEAWGLPNNLMIARNFKFLLTVPLFATTTGKLLAIRKDDLTMPTSLPMDLHRSVLQSSTAIIGLDDSRLTAVFCEDTTLGLYFMILEIDPCNARDENDVCLRCPAGLLRDSDSPDNKCVSQDSLSQGQGVRQSDGTIMPCEDPDCIDCFEDISRCRECRADSSKLIFRDQCIHYQELPVGFGVDPVLGLAKICEASNCLNCRQNNKECTACASSFRLENMRCEACQAPHCRSCPTDSTICSECDEIGGFFLESERKCSAVDFKLRETIYLYESTTIKLEFTRPIRVDNLTGLLDSTTIMNLQDQRVFRCSSKLCHFSVNESTSELVISLFPQHLASKPLEAQLTIDSSPDFSIVSTHSTSWIFIDYPITVKHLYLATSDSSSFDALNPLIAFLVYYRIPMNVVSCLLAPSMSPLVDEAFSFLHIHRHYKADRLGVVRYFHLRLFTSEAGTLEKAILTFFRRSSNEDCFLSLYSTDTSTECITRIMMARSVVSVIAACATAALLSVFWWSLSRCIKWQAKTVDSSKSPQTLRSSQSLRHLEKQVQSLNLSSRFFFQRIEGMRLLLLTALLLAVQSLNSSHQKTLSACFVASACSYYLLFWTISGRLLCRLSDSRKHLTPESSKKQSITVRDHMKQHNIDGGLAVHLFEGTRMSPTLGPVLLPAASAIKDLCLATLGVLLLDSPAVQSLALVSAELVYLFAFVSVRGKLSSFEHSSESLLLFIRVCLFGIRAADHLLSLDPVQRQTWKGWTTVYLMLTLVIAASLLTVVSIVVSLFRIARSSRSPLQARVDHKPIFKVKSILRSSVRVRQTGRWINRIQLHKEYIQLIAHRSSRMKYTGQPPADRCDSPRVHRSIGSVSARRHQIHDKPIPRIHRQDHL